MNENGARRCETVNPSLQENITNDSASCSTVEDQSFQSQIGTITSLMNIVKHDLNNENMASSIQSSCASSHSPTEDDNAHKSEIKLAPHANNFNSALPSGLVPNGLANTVFASSENAPPLSAASSDTSTVFSSLPYVHSSIQHEDKIIRKYAQSVKVERDEIYCKIVCESTLMDVQVPFQISQLKEVKSTPCANNINSAQPSALVGMGLANTVDSSSENAPPLSAASSGTGDVCNSLSSVDSNTSTQRDDSICRNSAQSVKVKQEEKDSEIFCESSITDAHVPYQISQLKAEIAENLLDIFANANMENVVTSKPPLPDGISLPSNSSESVSVPNSIVLQGNDQLKQASTLEADCSVMSPSLRHGRTLQKKVPNVQSTSKPIAKPTQNPAYPNPQQKHVTWSAKATRTLQPPVQVELVDATVASLMNTQTSKPVSSLGLESTLYRPGVNHCKFCGKDLSWKGREEFFNHMQEHDVTRFTCKVCCKGFKKREKLKDHIRIHIGEEKFACKECGKMFVTKATLRVHISHHHRNRGPARRVKCEECGKEISSGELAAHKTIHSSERPYICDMCGKCFKGKMALITHIKSHDNTLYPCKICGKMYKTNTMKSHRRSHKQKDMLQCEICGAQTANKQTLKAHMTVHTGEQPYICEICGRRFARKYNMFTHLKLHKGIRPLSCDNCGRKFSQMWNLKKHVQSCLKVF